MSLRAARPMLCALVLLSAACSASEISLSGPSASKCRVAIANSLETVSPAGSSGTLTLTTERDCVWAASSGAAWVVLTSATSGQGSGTIGFRVAANAEPRAREASIEVNEARATIAQQPAECRFTLTPAAPSIAADGGTVGIQVQPSANCPWSAATEVEWLQIAEGATGTGGGTVTLAVDPNAGPERSGRVVVAGEAVVVTQDGAAPPAPAPSPSQPPSPGCTYAIRPAGQTAPAAGGSGSIAVTAGAACGWTAVSTAGWIAITSGASGTGNGTVEFTVAANGGASRTGAISVAGQTFTVTQGSVACSYSINPDSQAMDAAGGHSDVAVTAGSTCAWTAASNASWITVASNGSGTGGTVVKLSVAANQGAARTGSATIAGHTFTVMQAAAPCGYTLTPSTIDMPAAGGPGSTDVATGTGCAWTAASNAQWIAITAGASGTGTGKVGFSVASNSGPARSGTMTVGGQTLTITQQPAPCTFAISPAAQSVPAAGGGGTLDVTAAQGCAWTAVSNQPEWLSVTSPGSGNGNGQVAFAAAPNGGGARVGTLTVAGHTFTVAQQAPCSYAVSPAAHAVAAAGATGTVTVTTGGGCAWTASSANGDWLTITAGESGTGAGEVSFSVAPNIGPARTGTLTVAGQPVTVDQGAP